MGWSLTGTTNSPNPNFNFLFQTTNGDAGSSFAMHSNPTSRYNPAFQNLPRETANATARAAPGPSQRAKSPMHSHSRFPNSHRPILRSAVSNNARPIIHQKIKIMIPAFTRQQRLTRLTFRNTNRLVVVPGTVPSLERLLQGLAQRVIHVASAEAGGAAETDGVVDEF